MTPVWESAYTPHIENVSIAGREFRFLIHDRQAERWYFPPKSHALLEYEWVANNVHLSNERIVDVGAHHGHYSMFFAATNPKPANLIAVEPLRSNCVVLEINAALNNFEIGIVQAAVSDREGSGKFIPRSNGKLFPNIGIEVPTLPLHLIDDSATVIKLDIEGSEFTILPDELQKLDNVHTWIIEVHTTYGNGLKLAHEFLQRDYWVNVLDKESGRVRTLREDDDFAASTTIFCTRA